MTTSTNEIAFELNDVRYDIALPGPSLLDRIVEALPFGRRDVPIKPAVLTLGNINLQVRQATTCGLFASRALTRSKVFRSIEGVEPPTKGTVRVNGRVSSASQIRARMPRDVTVQQGLEQTLVMFGSDRDEAERQWEPAILFAGMLDVAYVKISSLPDIDVAKLSAAACLFTQADIYLLDEMSLLQPPVIVEKLANRAKLLSRIGKTALLASVDADWLARACDQMVSI